MRELKLKVWISEIWGIRRFFVCSKSTYAINLCVIFNHLSFNDHINSVCKSSHYPILDLYLFLLFNLPMHWYLVVQGLLQFPGLYITMSSHRSSREYTIPPWQWYSNSQILICTVNPVRQSIHWLSKEQRINCKICLFLRNHDTIITYSSSYLKARITPQPISF